MTLIMTMPVVMIMSITLTLKMTKNVGGDYKYLSTLFAPIGFFVLDSSLSGRLGHLNLDSSDHNG